MSASGKSSFRHGQAPSSPVAQGGRSTASASTCVVRLSPDVIVSGAAPDAALSETGRRRNPRGARYGWRFR
jgi:hypothetical protein